MSTRSNPQPILSEKAAALLGHLVTLADSKGEVAVTRKKLAMALGASVPTVSRALRELKEAGLLAVMAEGGGRGQPTRYRITALAREPVPANRGIGDSCYPSAGASTGKSTGKGITVIQFMNRIMIWKAYAPVALSLVRRWQWEPSGF